MTQQRIRKIGIIGAGFSGTALALAIKRLSTQPIDIFLCDRNGEFGVGEAYRTPYPFHLLNVRAEEMSAFDDEPDHFVNWLNQDNYAKTLLDDREPIARQFVPRLLYRHYLQSMLANLDIHCLEEDIVDVHANTTHLDLISLQKKNSVDQIIFALGNNPAALFPFPITDTNVIHNPWDYRAPEKISKKETVLIIGTGLSMIDTVLTLYHQGHEGKIYALSRHGLLPLPHRESQHVVQVDEDKLPDNLLTLMSYVRGQIRDLQKEGQDWRHYVTGLRPFTQTLWQRLGLKDKKCFLRHALSYWNIHRHRVHVKIYELLQSLMAKKQLEIIACKVNDVNHHVATIRRRHEQHTETLNVDWVVNCLGPKLTFNAQLPKCVAKLYATGIVTFDPMQLGFYTNQFGAILNRDHHASERLFSLGPPTKGMNWECTAVPDIRKQAHVLARYLLWIR